MTYKQLIYPNLDDDPKKPLYIYDHGKMLTNWCGWCLAAVKAAYGATKSMGTALNAWNADQTKHSGSYDLPDGLYVPVWYSGDKDNYGHVVIAQRFGSNVKIWSTPYTKGDTFITFSGELHSTIETVMKKFGCKTFLGWTERVCEKTVIQAIQDQNPSENGSNEATEPTNDNDSSEPTIPVNNDTTPPDNSQNPGDQNKNDDSANGSKDEVEPAHEQDAKLIGELIEEASSVFNPSDTVKIIAYLIGDAFLIASLLVPDIVNTIQAPTLSVWAEYLSKVLLESGISILLVFKLIKKKGK